MFDELLPLSLSAGAAQLGVEPLEIVRLMVESDTVPAHLQLSNTHLEKLATLGGIESGWWDGLTLPTDSNASRATVRAALGLLGDRASAPVRMDNLWRGRSIEDQELIEEALNLLDEEGIVQIVNASAGVQVVVDGSNLSKVKGLAAGTETVDALDELYQG